MRTLTAIAIHLVLWLLMWTSAVTVILTIDRLVDPGRRGNWIRVLGVATLVVSLMIVLWLVTKANDGGAE